MEFEKMSVAQIKESILGKLRNNFACDTTDATPEQLYQALALVVRDEIMQRRADSRGVRKETGSKKVYYLSAEFLVGRSLFSNMVNLVNEKNYQQALEELGIDKELLMLVEHMVLSHHGEPEFGAAVRPMFLEAEILSQLDTLDATIYEITSAVGEVKEGEFTGRMWALDNRKLFNHGVTSI